MLANLRLKVTPPDRFNDPFELLPKLDFNISREAVESKLAGKRLLRTMWKEAAPHLDFDEFKGAYLAELSRKNKKAVRETVSEFQKLAYGARDGLVGFISSRFGLVCYSEVPDNILMWSHYASSHQGIVIGFDTKHAFFRKSRNLMPVMYQSERVEIAFDADGFKISEANQPLLVRSKSPNWSYEKEWRQLFSLDGCTDVPNHDGSTAHFKRLPAKAIAEVVLGCRCSAGTRSAVAKLLAQKVLRHVKLKEARLHHDFFRLQIADA